MLLLEIDSKAYLLFLPFLHRDLLLCRDLLHRDLLHHELLALLLQRGHLLACLVPATLTCGVRDCRLALMIPSENVHRLIHVTFEPTIALILTRGRGPILRSWDDYTQGGYCCVCAAVTQEDRM